MPSCSEASSTWSQASFGSKGHTKKRVDGTKRVFGGLNVVLCGDFWQLHPVSGTFLCSNPIDVPAGRARNALNLFWDEGPDTIRSYWPLTEVMRCRDPWYRDFLQQCRKGSLSCEMYCFFSWLANLCCCESPLYLQQRHTRRSRLGVVQAKLARRFL